MKAVLMGLCCACCACAAWGAPTRVALDEVQLEDADTLRVSTGGVAYRVQLPGVDAPEDRDNPKLQRDVQRTGLDAETLLDMGRSASAGVGGLLPDFAPYHLDFDPQSIDRYGRVPGDLLDGEGRRLSVRIVEEGYAIPVAAGSPGRSVALYEAAAGASAGRRGLWGSHESVFRAWAGPTGIDPAR